MIDRLGAHPVPLQLPIGAESEFEGIVDLINMKEIVYKDDLGKNVVIQDIRDGLREEAAQAREVLLDEVSHYDDELLEMILEEQEIPKERLVKAIRGDPVLADDPRALRLLVQEPWRAAAAGRRYLELPAEPAGRAARARPGPRQGRGRPRCRPQRVRRRPFSALAFKIMADPYVGKLAYFRVYSGKLEAGSRVLNVTTGRTERIGRILMMHANDREDVQEVYAGDIAAAVGIKQVVTGDTLPRRDKPIKLEAITFDDPVISVAIEPQDEVRPGEDVGRARRLAEEDPTFQVRTNEETGQTRSPAWASCTSRCWSTACSASTRSTPTSAARVSYRETVKGTAHKIEGRFVRQTGGSGQYGIVYIDIEPAPGEGFDFVNKVKGGSVPTEFIPAIEKGVEEALETGVRAGYPMVDVRVTLTDGKYHDTDSSEIAFKIAGSLALQEGGQASQADAAGARLRGRGRDPGGVHGRRDRRSQPPARSRERHGAARKRPGGQRARAAERDVRLRDGRALDDPGTGHVHHAVRQAEEVPPNIAEKVVEARTGDPVPA